MMLILVSLFWVLFFATLVILTLNYATFLWENKRVNDLASRIKPVETDILHKSSVNREFTSFDLRTAGLKSGNPKFGQNPGQNIYDRTLVLLQNQNYPDWLNKILTTLRELRTNTVQVLKGWIDYLLNLSKPNEPQEVDFNAQVKEEDINQTVEKLKESYDDLSQAGQGPLNSSLGSNLSNPIINTEPNLNTQQTDEPARPGNQTNLSTATIGLSSVSKSTENGHNGDRSLFEKVENRILEKLKTSGLNNYDIWLELGELYVKYDEKEKATEVFALVLKHTTDEHQKEQARNFLIGL